MSLIQLLVVDDHNLFRRGLIALLKQDGRFDVVGEAGDLGQALRCAGQIQPDLILLDNHLPGVRGVDGIGALKQAFASARILMLTVSENEEDLATAMQAGADGYLLKTVESDQLCQAIVRVLAGEPVISPEMMTKFVAAFRTKPQPPAPPETLAPVTAPPPQPGGDPVGPGARDFAAGGPWRQQQGDRPPARHCRDHGQGACSGHPTQTATQLPGAGGPIRGGPRPGLIQIK